MQKQGTTHGWDAGVRVGTPTVSYTRGTDLSGSLEAAGGIGGLLARTANSQLPSTNAHAFYHADGNGNITYLVNSSQTVAASYRYDPFGNTTTSSGTLATANVYRFSSKEIHVKSGLYYYGFRWYDPNAQRWPNTDPIAERGGINLYEFAFNSPTLLVDPHGKQSLAIWAGFLSPAFNLGRYICGGIEGYVSKERDLVDADGGIHTRYAHCMASCRIANSCGKDVSAVAGLAKEIYDIGNCLLTGSPDHCGSASQPTDYEDNRVGRDGDGRNPCKKDDCESRCDSLKREKEGPGGPLENWNRDNSSWLRRGIRFILL